MTRGFGFKDYSVAKRLKAIGIRGTLTGQSESELGNGWILKTPAGGIPARNGSTCGSADCTVQRIDKNGQLIDWLDSAGATVSIKIYNPFEGGAVAGDTIITAKNVAFEQVVDAEDCPPEGGTAQPGLNMRYQGTWQSGS